MKRGILPAVLCLVLFACQSNKEELVNNTCSTANVTYSNTISGIINTNGCLNCHGGTTPIAPFSLQTYEQVKAKATQTRNNTSVLHGALAHMTGFSPMPKGLPQLNTCDLSKVKAWIDAGMPQ
jgi:hypothetical protein